MNNLLNIVIFADLIFDSNHVNMLDLISCDW